MMERTYTSSEAKDLAVSAAQEALARFVATHPTPTNLTLAQAAEMLAVSPRTIQRMGAPRVGGRIPYSWVIKQLDK